MQIYHGKSVSGGIAAGTIHVFSKKEQQIVRIHVTDTEAEQLRFTAARQTALRQLSDLYDKACQEVGEANAAIFEVHQMMLEDEDFTESVRNIIQTQQVNAEYAIGLTADNFASMFSSLEDEYMRARAADIKDLEERLLTVLREDAAQNVQTENSTRLPSPPAALQKNEPEAFILLAEDLAPSETVQMDKEKILSFVTRLGSLHSHTAILARTMEIPALVDLKESGLTLTEALEGKPAIVDGFHGILYLDPDEETKTRLLARKKQEEEQKDLLLTLRGKEDRTKDGHPILLYANIGSLRDLAMVLRQDAAGIGLFRSEFLYLERDAFPTENEQFQIYKTVAETMAGKRVIIRTMDIGADKTAGYFHLDPEENPALGYRAIRIGLSQPEIFKTQLRAILRAGIYGNIAVMYPMITSLSEIRQIKALMQECKRELNAQGIAYADLQEGIMIETPAAALISEALAKEVDFFSIGTNDLTQYTLALDRQNPKLDSFYDPHHPAIFKLIQMTVDNAHKAGIWAGICGELGADPALTQTFLRMGVDELSVSPASILPIRKIIRETTL